MAKTHFCPPGPVFSEPSGEQSGSPDIQNRQSQNPIENSELEGGSSVHSNGQTRDLNVPKGGQNGPPAIDVFGPPGNFNGQRRSQNGSQDGPKVNTDETQDYNGTQEEQNGPPPMNFFSPPGHINGPPQGQKESLGNGLQYCPPWAYGESSRGVCQLWLAGEWL